MEAASSSLLGLWEDPHLRAYMSMLRRDPCSYCGGDGGTIDHVAPRGKGSRRDWENMTGACEECNRRKDKGNPVVHRDVLTQLAACLESQRRAQRATLLARLRPGDLVFTPWGDAGSITRVEGGDVYVWLPGEEREWRCANPAALRDARGNRLVFQF